MEIEEYKKMYELEEANWWFASKRRLIFSFFKKYYPGKNMKRRILDIGCGTGIILKEFGKYGKAYGADYSEHALKFCRMRGLRNVKKASVSSLPFESGYFDAIGCFDVLYHKNIRDDTEALKEIARVCKKNGRLFITDSAFNFLSGRHDIASHARTRYTAKELRQKLGAAGFEVEKLTYYNFFLFPFVFLMRKTSIMRNAKKNTDIKKENFLTNSLLKSMMSAERILLNAVNFPFGVSLFCIARRA